MCSLVLRPSSSVNQVGSCSLQNQTSATVGGPSAISANLLCNLARLEKPPVAFLSGESPVQETAAPLLRSPPDSVIALIEDLPKLAGRAASELGPAEPGAQNVDDNVGLRYGQALAQLACEQDVNRLGQGVASRNRASELSSALPAQP